MSQRVEVIYENGLLRPLEAVALNEGDHALASISRTPAEDPFLAQIRAELATVDRIPTLEEVRDAMSWIKDSMSEFVIAQRGEY